MAEMENSKDLISVLWSGADILRSKMDANEYKNYLLGIIFYKYLSDSFLIKVYDMIFTSESQFPIQTIQLSTRNTKEKKNMSELESMIEEKLIEQLIYRDSQWNNFSESIKVSKYQAK